MKISSGLLWIIIWQGCPSALNGSFFGWDFATWTISMERVISRVFFQILKAGDLNKLAVYFFKF